MCVTIKVACRLVGIGVSVVSPPIAVHAGNVILMPGCGMSCLNTVVHRYVNTQAPVCAHTRMQVLNTVMVLELFKCPISILVVFQGGLYI